MKAKLSAKFLTLTLEKVEGPKPWAAQILGLDPARGFDRKFIGVQTSALGTGESKPVAEVRCPATVGNIYEFGNWSFSADGAERRLYAQITESGIQWLSAGNVTGFFQQDTEDAVDVALPF